MNFWINCGSLPQCVIIPFIIIALENAKFGLGFNLFDLFQHKYHTKIDDLIEKTLVSMKSGLVAKLTSVLKSVLEKLGRYDEGTVFGSILSSLVMLSFSVKITSVKGLCFRTKII